MTTSPSSKRSSVADFDKPRIIEYIHQSLNYTVYDTKWVPSSARFVSLGSYPRGTGVIQVYTLHEGNKVWCLYVHL